MKIQVKELKSKLMKEKDEGEKTTSQLATAAENATKQLEEVEEEIERIKYKYKEETGSKK